MNILLSAYACEPNRGSEPGIGWNWAKEIAALGHNVWVITRSNNKDLIESTAFDREHITFVYYDLPRILIKTKPLIGVNAYYALWLFGIVFPARSLNKHVTFDVIHHITFGVFRHICYLPFFIKVPFVFGPVGGGERAPYVLRKAFGVKGWLTDFFRDVINTLTFYNPLYRLFLSKTSLIFCKTTDTMQYIPRRYRYKASVKLEIGINQIYNISAVEPRSSPSLIFVGRFVYLKRADIVLKAFYQVQKQFPSAELIMIGSGDELARLKTIEHNLSIKNVEWIDWIDQQKLQNYYQRSKVMIFPSMHDSSGNVVLESLSHGVPVVCLDLGGPAEIIGPSMPTVIPTTGYTDKDLIFKIAQKIIEIVSNDELYQKLQHAARERALQFLWPETIKRTYKSILELVNLKNQDRRPRRPNT